MEFKTRVLLACNTLTAIGSGPYADHMRLAYRLGRDHLDIDFHQFFARRLSIDRFRNFAVQTAIKQGLDYIMFIDDDMQLPADTFKLMYQACVDENYDIVSALNYIRGYPFKIMSFKWDLAYGRNRRLINLAESDLPDPLGSVVPCNAIGTAVCLIKVAPLRRTPAPWFLTGPHGTEDIYMCLKVADYYPQLKIGTHTGVVTGHHLDSEVISHYTRKAHMEYVESFMSPEEVQKQRMEDPRIAQVPKVGNRELYYEDLMSA